MFFKIFHAGGFGEFISFITLLFLVSFIFILACFIYYKILF